MSGSQSRRIRLKGHQILRSGSLLVHLKFDGMNTHIPLESENSIEDD